jgi:hypothetical protein
VPLAALGLSGCGTVSPSLSPAPRSPESSATEPSAIAVIPFERAAVDVVTVEVALRPVVPDLALAAYRDADGLDVFPPSSFANQSGFDRIPRVGRVLVFPSETERIATQPRFGEMSIRSDGGTLHWDRPTHSEWIGARNVIVEVEMPGGTFGKVTPWTDPDAFLAAIRSALGGL